MSLDSAPPYRVLLNKTPTQFLLVVDDEGDYAKLDQDDYTPERQVVDIERVSDHPIEADLQRNALHDDVFETTYRVLTYTAVSAAHAAGLARRDHHEQWALIALEDVLYADENAFPGIAAYFND